MGMDYYGVLKVSATANEEELRRSYKKLAMRWHPDKHPSGAKGLAEAKFKQICEAYDVLSDSQKRQIYDLYGEDGLKYNVSSPNAPPRGGGGNNNNSKTTSFKNTTNNNNRDYFDDEFFNDVGSDKSRSPKSDFKREDSGKKGENLDGIYDRSNNNKYGRMGSKERKAEDVENKLVCSLEDLYKGSKRKMKISRIVSDQFGKPTTVEEVLAIDIRPGWKKGTKITFPEKGNQEAGLLPGDLIFVIDEKPHPTFKRDGNDLLLSQKLTLLEALTGKILSVTTLDGRVLDIEVSDIVIPGHEVVIAGEGMPISKEPKKRGNLRIKFDIKFPSRLSLDQKADLRRVLSRN